MKKVTLSLLLLTAAVCCSPRQSSIKGIVGDASMNTATVFDNAGDTLAFSTMDSEKIREEQITCRFEGLLPATDGPGILYSLTITHHRHSGDGTFTLTTTYIEAEDGKNAVFSYKGRRYTQRGIHGDNDATVWQCVSDNGEDIFNFLKEDEETLVLLNGNFEKSPSHLDYSLKKII